MRQVLNCRGRRRGVGDGRDPRDIQQPEELPGRSRAVEDLGIESFGVGGSEFAGERHVHVGQPSIERLLGRVHQAGEGSHRAGRQSRGRVRLLYRRVFDVNGNGSTGSEPRRLHLQPRFGQRPGWKHVGHDAPGPSGRGEGIGDVHGRTGRRNELTTRACSRGQVPGLSVRRESASCLELPSDTRTGKRYVEPAGRRPALGECSGEAPISRMLASGDKREIREPAVSGAGTVGVPLSVCPRARYHARLGPGVTVRRVDRSNAAWFH